jgi:hypothetical protein
MNRWMMKLLAGACICAAACGDGTMPAAGNQPVNAPQGGSNDPGPANGTGGNPGTTPDPAPSVATFELRLLGVDAGSLRSVRLRVKSVEIRAGATVLATGANAFLLSTFQVPAGKDEVEFTIALDSASVESASGNFDVDAGCEVLKLRGKVSLIAQRNHAVVLLDLARSFVKVGTAMMLVPHLQLVF